MSSEILILEREKSLGFYSNFSNTYQIASFWGPYCHYMVRGCIWGNYILEGSMALGNDECYENKVLYTTDEYNECISLSIPLSDTEIPAFSIAYRVEKPFFDALYQELSSEEFLERLPPDSHNGGEGRYLLDLIPNLDFEHNYYFVLSLGDPEW